jgi:hypothetical protein
MQLVASTHPSSASTRDDVTCTTHRCASTSLEARLKNPSATSFQVKQVVISRRVSHTNLPTSVLWRNRQTVTGLILSPKPKNRHSDFETQIIKPKMSVLKPKSKNRSTLVLRLNQETHAPCLYVHGTDRTQCHLNSRSPGHRVPDLCLTIPGPLHQVFYFCHDPHRCPPCHTCYLQTTRQANSIHHTKQE